MEAAKKRFFVLGAAFGGVCVIVAVLYFVGLQINPDLANPFRSQQHAQLFRADLRP